MTNIILCGCGALGSNIAMGIVRDGDTITLYDDDKVDEVNVRTGTTIYSMIHVGKLKVDSLARTLVRKYDLYASYPINKTVNSLIQIRRTSTSPLPDLIIDCFDNREARSYTIGYKFGVPVVHVSVGEQGLGAIEWDDVYELPESGYERGENPVCTNELGRDLILFTSTVASIIINQYLSNGEKKSVYVKPGSLEIFG